MKLRITVITPTGDRPLAFSLLKKWMQGQTVKPDQWIVIDDGKISLDIMDSGEMLYVRRQPKADDPKHTLALNLRTAFPLVTGDRILIMEDDEYYAPEYIETMVRALETHLVAGIKNAKYYHLPTGGFYQNHNDRHASLAETAFRAAILPDISEIIAESDDPFIDIKIWKRFYSMGKLFEDTDRPLYLGIKGLPGRPGIGGGHKETLYRGKHDSPDREILRRYCPKDFGIYLEALSTAFKNKDEGSVLRRVPVDIIVPTYENEDLTIACFESIKRCTDPAMYRLIWVDNASRDISKVEKALQGMSYVSVRLSKNLGFVGAVNEGIRLSNSDYICLLNNDTIVSTGWLDKLTAAFSLDSALGIIGAVTAPPPASMPKGYDSHHNIRFIEDHAGRRIFPPYEDLEGFNRKIETQFDGALRECAFVAFLCAVIKRAVIDKVGLLDVNYAMGMYDDNDYNLAARKAGFKAMLLYSTCIYHRGRSTFNMVEKTERLDVPALLRKNRQYLMRKWGLKNA